MHWQHAHFAFDRREDDAVHVGAVGDFFGRDDFEFERGHGAFAKGLAFDHVDAALHVEVTLADVVVQCGRPDNDDVEAAESAPGYNVVDELPGTGEYAEGVVAIANTGSPNTGGGQWFVITGDGGAALPPQYTVLGKVTKGLTTTVQALENLADPTAENGVPPLAPVTITSVTITES